LQSWSQAHECWGKRRKKSNWFEPSKGIGKKEEAAAVAIKSDSKVLPLLWNVVPQVPTSNEGDPICGLLILEQLCIHPILLE